MITASPRVIAFYLPQFHPIPENSEWWGPGFTEWHNVAKARPLFAGHLQPNLPGELGFYDLRLADTRKEQALLARQYGVHGFCYWHYWFAGRRLLEAPLNQVLQSGEPDFPFCIGWANEAWTGVWHGAPRRVLMEQQYPFDDPDRHYDLLRSFFADPRYICLNGKPLFYVYKPREIPAKVKYLSRLRELARTDGYPGLHILGTWTPNPGGRFDSVEALGLDGAVITNISGRHSHSHLHWVNAVASKFKAALGVEVGPARLKYIDAVESMLPRPDEFEFPAYNCVVSNWDNTPRSGRRGLVLTGGSPERFRAALKIAFDNLERSTRRPPGEYVFLKSWNEWAEGNYVEPDQRHGREWLEAIRSALDGWSERGEIRCTPARVESGRCN